MTIRSTLCVSLAWVGLHAPAQAFEGNYGVGVGRDRSTAIIRRLSERDYRLTVETTEGACTGRVEARAVLADGVLTTTRGRVPGPGAEAPDICQMTVARTPDGIRIEEGNCSIFHGMRCGFAGVYRGSGAGRAASAARPRDGQDAPARASEFYCKTPDTIEPEYANNPNYRVKLPPATVRPELAYEIFRHGNRFAFPAPDGDPSEVMTITGVKFASKDDTLTVTGPGGQRWFVKPVGAAVIKVSGHGIKRPVTGRGCVWR